MNKFLKKFTTGDEPEYDPESWSEPSIEGSHNCYAYFLDDHIPSVKKECNDVPQMSNSFVDLDSNLSTEKN